MTIMKLHVLFIILHVYVHFTLATRNFSNETKIIFDYLTVENKGRGLEWLEKLCDDFGPRHSGSLALERAIDWIVESSRDKSITIHTEPVPGIPNFIRKKDEAWVTKPRIHQLNVLAIDESFPAKIEAEAIVLRDFDDLKAANVSGKIVVMNMIYKGYSNTVSYRTAADKISEKGGIGYLVSSVTPKSIYSPHTGFGARGVKIPVASIPTEEAQMLGRWAKRGKKVTIKLSFESRKNGTVISRNTILELKGTTKPDEIVLIGGHSDSWDVGLGAIDNGGGAAAVRSAIISLAELARKYPSMAPKRTIRAVFWTAEEQGYFGSDQYFKDHKDEKIVFAGETDIGAFKPKSYNAILQYTGNKVGRSILDLAVRNLNAVGIPLSISDSKIGGDIQLFSKHGVPCAYYISDQINERYFPLHHTRGDYPSAFTPEDIDAVAAIYAVAAFHYAQTDHKFEELIDDTVTDHSS